MHKAFLQLEIIAHSVFELSNLKIYLETNQVDFAFSLKKRIIKFKSHKLMKHVYKIQKSIFEGIKKIHVCSKAKDLQKFIMEIKMKKQILNIKKTRDLFYQYEQSHEANDFIQ